VAHLCSRLAAAVAAVQQLAVLVALVVAVQALRLTVAAQQAQ
jgi:hypothetical protein